jgi:hypothetical protein
MVVFRGQLGELGEHLVHEYPRCRTLEHIRDCDPYAADAWFTIALAGCNRNLEVFRCQQDSNDRLLVKSPSVCPPPCMLIHNTRKTGPRAGHFRLFLRLWDSPLPTDKLLVSIDNCLNRAEIPEPHRSPGRSNPCASSGRPAFSYRSGPSSDVAALLHIRFTNTLPPISTATPSFSPHPRPIAV